MKNISEYIDILNRQNKKALSVFLTAGFPNKKDFTEIAKRILDNGADILEIGIPFSDPLADGQVIQTSSQIAIENQTSLEDVFEFCDEIKNYSDKPLILMGYSNPILKYGKERFCNAAIDAGVSGLIVPDIPLEEYDSFYSDEFGGLQKILLTTPTSTNKRIKLIDEKSEGFVYCVSVTGTTGARYLFDDKTYKNLERTYSLINKNKMMIGFGISNAENIKSFIPFCDGVIVGSAVIKTIMNTNGYEEIVNLVRTLNSATFNT